MQRLQNPPIKGVKGVLLVLALVASVILDSFLAQLLIPKIGEGNAAILFWGIGIAIAGYVLWRYILAYVYTYTSMLLRICRAYGKRERLAEDIYFRSLVFAGTPEKVREKYPGARVRRAVRSKNPLPKLAFAYQDGDKVAIYIVQPEDALRQKILDSAKSNKK